MIVDNASLASLASLDIWLQPRPSGDLRNWLNVRNRARGNDRIEMPERSAQQKQKRQDAQADKSCQRASRIRPDQHAFSARSISRASGGCIVGCQHESQPRAACALVMRTALACGPNWNPKLQIDQASAWVSHEHGHWSGRTACCTPCGGLSCARTCHPCRISRLTHIWLAWTQRPLGRLGSLYSVSA